MTRPLTAVASMLMFSDIESSLSLLCVVVRVITDSHFQLLGLICDLGSQSCSPFKSNWDNCRADGEQVIEH